MSSSSFENNVTNIYSLINHIYYRAIDLMGKVFANGPGYRASIPGLVISKTQKIVLDAILLNTAL